MLCTDSDIPPKVEEVKKMKCTWITYMHALYRFIHTPQGYEVHKMTCTCISHMHALYRCRHTPQDQLDSGMRYQLLLWDEVYRLWYFNDHITTLVISEKLVYDIYWRYKETKHDFPSILQQITYIHPWKHQVW